MDILAATSWATGIIGVATGTSGLVLGILNYWRDKPSVQIILTWDMEPSGNATNIYDKEKRWGVISVANIGRRPIFVSHLSLETPGIKGCLFLIESVSGAKLLEGDPPKQYMVSQEGLEKYANYWNRMRAVIIDSSGKKYCSKPAEHPPSWSKR